MTHKPGPGAIVLLIVYAVAMAAGAAFERFRRQISGWFGNTPKN